MRRSSWDWGEGGRGGAAVEEEDETAEVGLVVVGVILDDGLWKLCWERMIATLTLA